MPQPARQSVEQREVLSSDLSRRVWNRRAQLTRNHLFFFQAEDGIRDVAVTGGSDVCSSDLCGRRLPAPEFARTVTLLWLLETHGLRAVRFRRIRVVLNARGENMNENPYVLEYSFVPTECGNFVITSKELKDDVYSILGGFSYGDNIAATGVFFVGELEMPNVEDFVNWAKEVEREYLAGKDVEHASVKVIRAHQSMEQVSEQHAIFRSTSL